MQRTTLSGSHGERKFVLEVSGETWDRFRDFKKRLQERLKEQGDDVTTGSLLAEMADTRADLSKEFAESDVTWYMDALDSFISGHGKGREAPAAPNTA